MSDNKNSVLVGMSILAAVVWVIGFTVFGSSLARMACVIISVSIVGWAIGYSMDTPCPAGKQPKS
jgi:hypothetical protein